MRSPGKHEEPRNDDTTSGPEGQAVHRRSRPGAGSGHGEKTLDQGFTTNPSLLRKAGVTDYEAYGRDLTAAVPDRHISFEVFSDDIPEMVAQARVIAQWGNNVYVKLPVTTTRGEPLDEAIRALSKTVCPFP